MSQEVNLETRLLDKALTANLSLWTALLTVNGFMATVFSVVAVTAPSSNKVLMAVLVVLSAVSVLLVVLNFLAVQRLFHSSGQQYLRGELPPPEQRAAEAAEADRSHTFVMARQAVALWLLAAQGVVLLLVLVCSAR